ncbi:MAG: alpha/beta fold hydrolase [Candidatus Thorarchaeota archaeon]
MPHAINEGVRIFYEVEGEGPQLVLLHGFGGSTESWRETGYVDSLSKDFHLIMVDARGHGASDKPTDPEEYRVRSMASDIVAVLDDLSIDKAHFLGYSMGGWIGFGILRFFSNRFHSVIIGGAQPYDQGPWKEGWLEIFKGGMDAAMKAASEYFGKRLTPSMRKQLMANDLDALMAMLSKREQLGLENALATTTVPVMVFIGKDDAWYSSAQKCVEGMANCRFVALANLNHVETLYRPDLVAPHIAEHVKSTEQK